jgi:hypothetical protein
MKNLVTGFDVETCAQRLFNYAVLSEKDSSHCADVRLLIQPEPSEREEMEVGEATARQRNLAAHI